MALCCDRIGLWLRELLRFPRRLLVCIIIGCIDCVSLALGATDGRSLEGEHRSGPPACIGLWCFSGLAARGRDVMSTVGMMKGRKCFMRAFSDRKLRVLISSIKKMRSFHYNAERHILYFMYVSYAVFLMCTDCWMTNQRSS